MPRLKRARWTAALVTAQGEETMFDPGLPDLLEPFAPVLGLETEQVHDDERVDRVRVVEPRQVFGPGVPGGCELREPDDVTRPAELAEIGQLTENHVRSTDRSLPHVERGDVLVAHFGNSPTDPFGRSRHDHPPDGFARKLDPVQGNRQREGDGELPTG